jgi:hypothetical protein
MTGEPPLVDGALHATAAEPSPAVAVGRPGFEGTVSGMTGEDGAEAGPRPLRFCAVTVKVYAMPFVSPLTVQVWLDPAAVHVLSVGVEVT